MLLSVGVDGPTPADGEQPGREVRLDISPRLADEFEERILNDVPAAVGVANERADVRQQWPLESADDIRDPIPVAHPCPLGLPG